MRLMTDERNKAQNSQDSQSEWVAIGFASDKITADYIIVSLRSYDIPSALNSKSGFLGDIGMTGVSSLFSSGVGAYEILVVAEKVNEALEIARMVAGENWSPIVDDGNKTPLDAPDDSSDAETPSALGDKEDNDNDSENKITE
ncbi:hypothetical protein JYT16_00335 [Gemmatimonas aurantiaca]|nr:hypothetical protein [Gemmatimonas aurantiaca]